MLSRRSFSFLVVLVVVVAQLLVAGGTAAAASCNVTAYRPTSGGLLPPGKMQGSFDGSCTGVSYVKTTTTLQLYVPAHQSWVVWAQLTTTPGPSNTYLAGGVSTNCTIGTSYLTRTKAVMKGYNSSNQVIATDSAGPTPSGGAFVTCR